MGMAAELKAKFPNLIESASAEHGQERIVARREGIRDLLTHLKNEPPLAFDLLADLSCADYLFWEEKAVRFEVIYNLYSTRHRHRLIVKAPVPESDASIDSAVPLWPAANWLEREVYDMFGIRFTEHPNLKRILMYDGFSGHALRKDYPFNKRQPLIGPEN